MILNLRLTAGVDIAAFEARHGASLDAAFGPTLDRYEGFGLLERADGRLRLTDRGLLLANEVFTALLPDDRLDAPTDGGA